MDGQPELGTRIALYRQRRGMSQTVLAGLVARSESWLSQVERGQRNVDKLSVLIPMAKALRVDLATLVGEHLDYAHESPPTSRSIDAIRAAMSDYVLEDDDRPIDLTELEAVVIEINALKQATQYDRAGSLLPTAIRQAEIAVDRAEGDKLRDALRLAAQTNQVTSAVLARIGHTDLGWVAADRAIQAAKRLNDIELVAAGIYRVGQVMLNAGRSEEAYELAESMLSTTDRTDAPPSMLSLHGSLLLTVAIAAARAVDRREATRHLAAAQRIADRLGDERNDHWTAFGPANVRIHATSAAVDLGDPTDVLNQAVHVDVESLPNEMRGRRSQVHLDMAWAYGQQRNDAAAVLALLEAERLAPDAVRHSTTARSVITDCLRRARRKGALPGLDQLAHRVGVLAS